MGNYPLDMFPLIPLKTPYMAKENKIMEFPTQYSESVKKGTFEYFTKPTMTEPDNSLSIPEIIARFTRGAGIQVPVHDWSSGSATEEGERFEDNERFFEEFVERKEAPKEAPKEDPKEAPKEAPSEGAE